MKQYDQTFAGAQERFRRAGRELLKVVAAELRLEAVLVWLAAQLRRYFLRAKKSGPGVNKP